MPIWPQTNAYFQEPNSEKTNNGIHYKIQLLYSNGKCTILYSARIDLQVFYSLSGAVLVSYKCSSVYSTNVILVDGKPSIMFFFLLVNFKNTFRFFFEETLYSFFSTLKNQNNFPQASEQNRIFMFG